VARIVDQRFYNGAGERIRRLGLTPLWNELAEILQGFTLRVLEKRDSNGGAVIREMIDARFAASGGWKVKKSGGVDWTICRTVNGTEVCLGVEVQFSGRSDLLIVDVAHLRDRIIEGTIDVGVVVAPSDRLAVFLTDRAPYFQAALTAVERARAHDLPLVVIALEHDGPGPALPKRRTRQGRASGPATRRPQ
jgi:hypothetical protein